MNKNTSQSPTHLFHNAEGQYFDSLEKFAIPLRQSASKMVAFIDQLDHQESSLKALKQSYIQFETIAIKDLYKGLETISTHLGKLVFLKDASAINQNNFIDFFTLQNQFSAQVNTLISHAMHIKR